VEGEKESIEPIKLNVFITGETPNRQLKKQVTYDYRIPTIPREENVMANCMAVSEIQFRIPLPPKLKYDVEIRYRPSVPDNIKH
jgi:hypothetical protein